MYQLAIDHEGQNTSVKKPVTTNITINDLADDLIDEEVDNVISKHCSPPESEKGTTLAEEIAAHHTSIDNLPKPDILTSHNRFIFLSTLPFSQRKTISLSALIKVALLGCVIDTEQVARS